MKKTFSLIAALIAVTLSSFAQSTLPQVVLCGNYDKVTGVPSDIYASWDIQPVGGSYVYVIYTQDKKIKDELSLRVEKKNYSGLYDTYATYSFNNDVKAGQNWAMYDMLFTEEGDYRINVVNKSNTTLASTNTSIFFVPEEEPYSTDDSYVDTYYYENSIITLGESVAEGGIMSGESTVFKLNNGTAKIAAMLEQDEPLLLSKVYVNVYMGEDEISAESYDIPSKDWNYINVYVTVNKPGSYYVDFYTQDDAFINTASFEVVE